MNLMATPTRRRYTTILPREDSEIPLSPQIRQIIRRKVSCYLGAQIQSTPTGAPSKMMTSSVIKKSKPTPAKQFPAMTTLKQFLKDQQTYYHIYKQRIDKNLEDCAYFYLKLLGLAMDYQCAVSAVELDREATVISEVFLFVATSFQEVGADQAAFYFASIGVSFCQRQKQFNPIGELILIMAKISRKVFRYRDSILLLKKALEYNWWQDSSFASRLQRGFKAWLSENSPDELQIFSQKYEVVRVYEGNSKVNDRNDLELQTFKELFGYYLQLASISTKVIVYDLVPKKSQTTTVNQRVIDLELEIYNELSYNFLQINHKQQSKIFAQKYETGYIEPQDSQIRRLSRQLITSVQSRAKGWETIQPRTFELLFFLDFKQVVESNKAKLKTMDQFVILDCFRVSFQTIFENLLKKDMFSYQNPLPLQIRRQLPRRKVDGRKFIVRRKSISHMSKQAPVIARPSLQKVEENLIFNYRGIGVSRRKLLMLYSRVIDAMSEKEGQGSFKSLPS